MSVENALHTANLRKDQVVECNKMTETIHQQSPTTKHAVHQNKSRSRLKLCPSVALSMQARLSGMIIELSVDGQCFFTDLPEQKRSHMHFVREKSNK